MYYIEAPNEQLPLSRPSIFMAGEVTGCPDWQQELRELLQDRPNGTLVNPRRKNFPIDDPNAAKAQIAWEEKWLRKVDYISFWFCKETLCPIVLFELGTCMYRGTPIIIGIEPDYAREQDVRIQTSLYMRCWQSLPDRQFETSLEGMADAIRKL